MEFVVKILKIENVTHNVKRFVVEKPDDYEFVPGQATLVSINKDGWRDEKRPFTFTSLPFDTFLEFVIKIYQKKDFPSHKGFTEELGKLKEGDDLILRDAWGAIKYEGEGVFIAGGAGLTPFIAIFRDLHSKGSLKGNKLIFSNKTAKDVILEHELEDLLGADLVLTLTDEKREGYEYGRINKDFLKKHVDDFNQKFYVCGPVAMVKDIKSVLEDLGASVDEVIFEK